MKPFTNDQEQIRSAFQERMVVLSSKNLNDEDIKSISSVYIQAYKILSNPSSKAEYDNLLLRTIVTTPNDNSGGSSSHSKKSTGSHNSSIGWNDFKPLVYIFLSCVVIALILTFTISSSTQDDSNHTPIISTENTTTPDKYSNNRRKTYDKLSESYNVGEFSDFENRMKNDEDRRKVHSALQELGINYDYDTFSKAMGYGNTNSSEELEQANKRKQTDNNQARKWVYGTLKLNGYNPGTEQEFNDAMNDRTNREYAYNALKDKGVDMGSYDDYERAIMGWDESKAAAQGIYSSRTVPTVQNKPSPVSNSTSKPTTTSPKVITPKEPEFDESTIVNFINGDMPYSSYYGTGIYNSRSLSELTLINYSSSDAVAIVEAVGGGVIRHAYIAEGRSFTMKQIPECICTVKIMFGERWSSEKDNGSGYPRGGFTKSTSYSEADTSFDFYSEEDLDGINYPTYSLTLHTVVGGNTSTSKISKDDFFN